MNSENQRTDFDTLVSDIREVHARLAAQASRAVNLNLTLRNWAIGFVIREYEQHGTDRATYGEMLLDTLADRLLACNMQRVSTRELRRYRLFYIVYPEIWRSAPKEFHNLLHSNMLQLPERIRETLTPELTLPGKTLITHLSFSHLAELISIDAPTKRSFYEAECIRGNWSVRELKRQIASLYFERTSLSERPKVLTESVRASADQATPELAIRDPYIFEFLGLRPQEVMYESDLENALLAKLQDFLLELGHGFCFEARQKRILIGDTYGFVDLVFYHRILKCHVLIDLKIEGFNHENIGQLNTYVSWYRKNVMADGDNPPVGLLLCTQKDHALVEYALAGMDNNLFVSKYELALPNKADLQRFLEDNIRADGEA